MEVVKRCLGYQCDIRDGCRHWVQPATATHFFQPDKVGEHCPQYEERRNWRDEDEAND